MIEPEPNCSVSIEINPNNNIIRYLTFGIYEETKQIPDSRILYSNIYLDKNMNTILEIAVCENDNIIINKILESVELGLAIMTRNKLVSDQIEKYNIVPFKTMHYAVVTYDNQWVCYD